MKKIILSALLLASAVTFAQDDKGFSFSGSIDTYAKANLNADQNQTPTTSFADQPGFALGMINLVASYEGEKVGFVADMVYGKRGADAVFNSTGTSSIVNQLYVYWNLTDKLTATMGNFNTFLGYEVISPAVNFNYSTSYMFSYGPFSHTGLKLDYAVNEDFSVMLAIMNATDNTDYNITGNYTLGAQLGYKGQFLNIIYGDQTMDTSTDTQFQIDYTGGFDLSESFYLGINTTYNTTAIEGGDDLGYLGAALYAQLATSESFSIGLRPEYFSTFGSFGAINEDTNGDGNIFALTLSANYKVAEGLTLIPEVRMDSASEPTYMSGAELNDGLASVLLAAVYSF